MAAPRRYLYAGVTIRAVSGVVVFYLSFKRFRCLSNLAGINSSVIEARRLEKIDGNCPIIANSCVYSVHNFISGIMLAVIRFMRKRRALFLNLFKR